MRLDVFVGQEVTVERHLGNTRWKGASRIIGARPARYLLLDMPKSNGNALLNAIGQKCLVHYFNRGVLTGFSANVLRIQNDPFPMVIMEFSQNLQEVTVREAERLDCHIAATFCFAPPEKLDEPVSDPEVLVRNLFISSLSALSPVKTAIVDLSKGGCLIDVPIEYWESVVQKSLQVKTMDTSDSGKLSGFHGLEARIHFSLPVPANNTETREVATELRWIKSEPNKTLLGLKFITDDKDLEEDIRKIIVHQREYFARHNEVG